MALTRDTQRSALYRSPLTVAIPAAADAVIYVGSLVAVNASGLAVPADDAAALRVVGVADSSIDNTGGSAGTLVGTPARFVRVSLGAYSFDVAGSVFYGAAVYVVDDDDLDVTPGTHSVLAGYVLEPDPARSGNYFVQLIGLGFGQPPIPYELDNLTDSSGGTADGTISAVGATNSGDVSGTINSNFKEVATQLAALRAALALNGIVVDVP